MPSAESLRPALAHKDHLEGGTALAVVGKGTEEGLVHRQLQIGVGQDDPRVLGAQAEHAAPPVRGRMLVFEDVRHPVIHSANNLSSE